MKRIFLHIIVTLLLVSCEEQVPWDQEGVFTPKLVVDGMITNMPSYNYIRLNLPISEPGEEPRTINEASITVSTADSTVQFIPVEEEPGLYIPEKEIRAVIGRYYLLNIQFSDHNFVAIARMIPVAPLKAFKYKEDDNNPGYYQIIHTDTNSPTMLRYIIEWTEAGSFEVKKSILYHYTLSTVDVNQFFKPDQQVISFPGSARIIREQYSLSPDHEKYIRSLLCETEWKGGLFDVAPGNLHTNISQGGVGYFAASSMLVDTVYFE